MVFESSHCYIVHCPDFPTPNLFNSPDSFDPTLFSWRSTTQRRNQNICQFDLFCILSLSPSKHISLKTKQHLSLRLWLWFCMVLSPREMRHDVHLEQLALLGLITLMEVYPVVLWVFLVTFKIKKWFPLSEFGYLTSWAFGKYTIWGVPEAWRQCFSSSMNSGKIGADGWTDRGSIRGPRGPKTRPNWAR